MKKEELRYLQRLAELYPTIAKASTEIINLQSILNLPKGTEHFMSDIHGEYDAFSHVLRNGSGAVRKKIDDVFGHTLSNSDKRSLATLIYYPKEKMEVVKKHEEDMENWYKITLYRLIEVCKTTASKYTRSKVRKALPADYAYVIEELITDDSPVVALKPGERIVRLSYVERNPSEPLISLITQKFGITLNIIFADVEIVQNAPIGGTVAIFSGDSGQIDAALTYLKEKNVGVEVIRQ